LMMLDQQGERARLQGVGLTGTVHRRSALLRPGGVNDGAPIGVLGHARQSEPDLLAMGIHQQQEIIVGDLLTPSAVLQKPSSLQKHSEAARRGLLPFVIRHLVPIWRQPEDVFYASALNGPPLEEIPSPEHRMLLAQ